jgi:hypothetical protein
MEVDMVLYRSIYTCVRVKCYVHGCGVDEGRIEYLCIE